MTAFTFELPRPQRGFTLVELMVAVAIGLLLMVITANIYLSSRNSFRINDENAKLQDYARSNLAKIGRHLTQAGHGVPQIYSEVPLLSGAGVVPVVQGNFTGNRLVACDTGFANPASGNFSCGSSTSPAFQVRYEVDSVPNQNTGAGYDCTGQLVPVSGSVRIVQNSFYLATPAGETAPALYCIGNGGGVPQILLRNIDSMQLTYWVSTDGSSRPNRFTTSAVTAASLALPNGLNSVIGVAVCLQVRSANRVSGSQSYVDCAGNTQTGSDGRIRTVVTNYFTLRNNSETSTLNYKAS